MKHEIDQRALRRDREFQTILAREYEVEQPPESYRKALGRIYAELPDELPVKRYPLRSALRGLAVTAAAVLLVCASMFGVNALNPELMESIPGLGEVFREINGTKPAPPDDGNITPVVSAVDSQTESDPAPEARVLPSPSPSAAPREAPAFQPVTAQGVNGLSLTVENAWSDGVYLHLKLRLDGADTQFDPGHSLLTWSSSTGDRKEGDVARVEVDGVLAEKLHPDRQRLSFGKWLEEGQDGWYMTMVLCLPEKTDTKKDFHVRVEIPELYENWYTQESDQLRTVETGFDVEFQVTADPSCNVAVGEPVTDNGVTLVSVDSTPSRLLAELEIPFLGRQSWTLLNEVSAGYSEESKPLGIYAVLRDAHGNLVDASHVLSAELYVDEEDRIPLYTESTEPIRGVREFLQPAWGERQLVLTLYEYYPGDFELSQAGESGDPPLKNRVVAEFTIDLERKTAYPSERYRESGREKLDAEKSLEEIRRARPVGGYFCGFPGEVSLNGDEPSYMHAVFYSEDLTYRPVEVRCYSEGWLVQTMGSHPPEEFVTVPDGFDIDHYPEEFRYYEDEAGQYWEGTTDPQCTQKAMRRLDFLIRTPGGETPLYIDRMDLADGETGEVLVEDVRLTYYKMYDEVMGTNWLGTLYGEGGASQGTASAPSGEMPPVPQPSPSPSPAGGLGAASSN